jgi:ATP-dependent Lon protease
MREIGTRAAVVELLARLEDGRMNILVEGRDRFKVRSLTRGRSFHTAEIEPLVDADDPAEEEDVERALALFDRLKELTGSDVEVPTPDDAPFSYALAARVELAPDAKQDLLQEVSERVRMERVGELFVEAAATVERQRRAAERAATNGKVDLG